MAEKLTNEQVDKINSNRKLLGETEMIPYEDAAPEGDDNLTEDQKLELEAKKKQDEEIQTKINEGVEAKIKEQQEEEKRIAKEKADKEKAEKEKSTFVEINDDSVLAYLKSKGKEVSSLDEILNPKAAPTEADIEKEKQQRESNKIAYALKEGKFSKTELENFITDSKNPQELVFSQYLAEQQKEDSSLSEKEIREEFEEKYGLDQEETTRKFKRGQTELGVLADNLLRKRHGKIIGFDNEYNQIEANQLSEKQVQQKILSQAPVYKKDVDDVYSELSKITVSFDDNSYEIEIPQDILDKQKEINLNNDFVVSQIKAGWTKDSIKQAATMSLFYTHFSTLAKSISDKHLLALAKGTHGIPKVGEKSEEDAKIVSERTENLRKYHGESVIANATN